MATNLHKNSDENNKHTPKGFSAASNMSRLLRDEEGKSTYTPEQMLPAAIDFVDGNAAPPTEVSGDIYVLIDLGSGAENAAWDGASYNDWVRFNGTVWVDITPSNGDICYDKSEDIYKRYESPNWVELVPDAINIYNADSTFTGNRIGDLNGNTLAFNNGSVLLNASSKVASEDILLSGQTYIQRASTSSADTVLSLLNNVGTELWDWRANGDVYLGDDIQANLTNSIVIGNMRINIGSGSGRFCFGHKTEMGKTDDVLDANTVFGYNSSDNAVRIKAPTATSSLFQRIMLYGSSTNIRQIVNNQGVVIGSGLSEVLATASANLEVRGDMIVNGSSKIGSEDISLQGDTYIGGYLELQNGLKNLGYTNSTGAPTTTELPADKNYSIHKDTSAGTVYLAYNDGGVIKTVTLT